MPPHEPYSRIAQTNYQRIIRRSARPPTNALLKAYFDACFTDTLQHFALYAVWCCTSCMRDGTVSYGWGRKPNRCPTCHQTTTYQVGTFNAWAAPVGAVFAAAVYFLLRGSYRVPLVDTPGNTKTHDFEITASFAIEAKGSPHHVVNPDGTLYELGRPGMERSDTEKKAFANAQTFKMRNPHAYYAILTNALPPKLLGYRNATVNGIFNVTKVEELNILMRDITERLPNINALRKIEGV